MESLSAQGSGTRLLAFCLFNQCILLFVALASEAPWPLPGSGGLDFWSPLSQPCVTQSRSLPSQGGPWAVWLPSGSPAFFLLSWGQASALPQPAAEPGLMLRDTTPPPTKPRALRLGWIRLHCGVRTWVSPSPSRAGRLPTLPASSAEPEPSAGSWVGLHVICISFACSCPPILRALWEVPS